MRSETLQSFYSLSADSTQTQGQAQAHGFEFYAMDILRLEARVKCLPAVYEANARLLEANAEMRAEEGTGTGTGTGTEGAGSGFGARLRLRLRLQRLALQQYTSSYALIPGSSANRERYEALQQTLQGKMEGEGEDEGGDRSNFWLSRRDQDNFELDIDVQDEILSQARQSQGRLSASGPRVGAVHGGEAPRGPSSRFFGCCQS